MSSNTNNLRAILDQLSDSSASRGWLDCKSGSEDTHPRNDLVQNALAAVLALLPEKLPVMENAMWDFSDGLQGHVERSKLIENAGFNEAIEKTRRNLIGEQHGDSAYRSESAQPPEIKLCPRCGGKLDNYGHTEEK